MLQIAWTEERYEGSSHNAARGAGLCARACGENALMADRVTFGRIQHIEAGIGHARGNASPGAA